MSYHFVSDSETSRCCLCDLLQGHVVVVELILLIGCTPTVVWIWPTMQSPESPIMFVTRRLDYNKALVCHYKSVRAQINCLINNTALHAHAHVTYGEINALWVTYCNIDISNFVFSMLEGRFDKSKSNRISCSLSCKQLTLLLFSKKLLQRLPWQLSQWCYHYRASDSYSRSGWCCCIQ